MIITLDNYKTVPEIEIDIPKVGYIFTYENNELYIVYRLDGNDRGILKRLDKEIENVMPIYFGHYNGFNIGGFKCISLTNTFQMDPIIVDSPPTKSKSRFELIFQDEK